MLVLRSKTRLREKYAKEKRKASHRTQAKEKRKASHRKGHYVVALPLRRKRERLRIGYSIFCWSLLKVKRRVTNKKICSYPLIKGARILCEAFLFSFAYFFCPFEAVFVSLSWYFSSWYFKYQEGIQSLCFLCPMRRKREKLRILLAQPYRVF